jgi:hypothetical protein
MPGNLQDQKAEFGTLLASTAKGISSFLLSFIDIDFAGD